MSNKLVACMCVRNEAYHLPGFFDHIRKYVDAFCVLDDGSTDDTLDILKREHKVERIIELPGHDGIDYDERGNREKVVRAAREIGADWVLCCDPDERFERRFLKDLKRLTNGGGSDSETPSRGDASALKVYGVHFRELWESCRDYRDDGIWEKKKKYILFPLQEAMSFDFPHQYHTYWHYRELDGHLELLPYNLYHLKMIKEDERRKRADLYNALDPELKIQPIGYDYLVDETDLHLTRIKFRNRYDYRTLPKDIRRDYR